MYVLQRHHVVNDFHVDSSGRVSIKFPVTRNDRHPMFQFPSNAKPITACSAMSAHSHVSASYSQPVTASAMQQLGRSAAAAPPAAAAVGNKRRHVACRVLTESATLDIGSKAPHFQLPEPLTGKTISLADVSAGAKATLVMFICNHCPFVVMLKSAIASFAKEYQAKGLAVVAISSNSTQTHPQDGPDKMAEEAKQHVYTFPYLFDETQGTAKAYKAACTPEFYVFDADMKLTYHGQFDDARPNNGKPVTGADLRIAVDAALAGSSFPADFKPRPSIGCNIKWDYNKATLSDYAITSTGVRLSTGMEAAVASGSANLLLRAYINSEEIGAVEYGSKALQQQQSSRPLATAATGPSNSSSRPLATAAAGQVAVLQPLGRANVHSHSAYNLD